MTTLNPPLCALVLAFNDEGQLLVSSRRYDSRVLNLPGGKADPEDVVGPPQFDLHNTLINCAVRELREETGLHVEGEDLALIYFGICEHEGSDFREPDSICATFLAKRWSGKPIQKSTEPPIRWASFDELIEHTPYVKYNRAVRAGLERYWELG